MMLTSKERSHISSLLRDAVRNLCTESLTYHRSLDITATVTVVVDQSETVKIIVQDNIDERRQEDDAKINLYENQNCYQIEEHNLSEEQLRPVALVKRHLIDDDDVMVNDDDDDDDILDDDDDARSCPAADDVDVKDSSLWETLSEHSPGLQDQETKASIWAERTSTRITNGTENGLGETITHKERPDKQFFGENKEVQHSVEDIVKSEDFFDPPDPPNEWTTDATDTDVLLCKQDNMYKCVYCSFHTEHGSAMSQHLKMHTKAKLKCTQCEKEFTCQSQLAQHHRKEHNPQYPCDVCGAQMNTKYALRVHQKQAHDGKVNDECGACGLTFENQDLLDEHIRDTHKFFCKMCNRKYSCKIRLNKHKCKPKDTGDADVLLKCPGCDYVGLSPRNLQLHKKWKSPEDTVCDMCQVTFVCRTQKRRHIHEKHPETVNKKQCNICGKPFNSRQGLFTHKKVAHPETTESTNKDPYTCHVCGKGFPVHGYLTSHLKSHTDELPYTCPKCHKSFKYHRNFKSHKEGCMNTSGFPCHICGKILKTEYTHKLHMRSVHSDNKPLYDCQHCGITFSYHQSRTKHERICSEQPRLRIVRKS